MSLPKWAAALVAVVAGLLLAASAVRSGADQIHAVVKARDGRELGRVKFVETVAGVLIKLSLKGLPPGVHAFHIHEVGKCDGDFASAGGVHNPTQAKHGFMNDEGPMVGDLPNLHVTAQGDVDVEMLNPFVTLARDSEETVLDQNGAAVVVFDQPDDYRSDPDGRAGSRIACGVIQAPK